METNSIKDKVREFLRQKIKDPGLADDTDYFQKRLVNSLFAMQLVLFVEKEFQLRIGDEDLALENFNSVNAITALVLRKKPVGG